MLRLSLKVLIVPTGRPFRRLLAGRANVVVSLATTVLIPRHKLPMHEIGQMAVNSLRRFCVDTKSIIRGGDRVGIYFLAEHPKEGHSAFMIERARPSRRLSPMSLIGTAFSAVPNGSTSLE